MTTMDRPLARLGIGGQGYGRALFAAWQKFLSGNMLAALDASHNDGPWVQPDALQEEINGIVRLSQGDALNGFALTAMGYHGQWNWTDTVPQRAITNRLIPRFGTLDPTDGGDSYRYSFSGDWQHGSNSTLTKVTAYGIGYDLNLFSNFTFYLDDPVDGDQHEQVDHRFVTGEKSDAGTDAVAWAHRPEHLRGAGAQRRRRQCGLVPSGSPRTPVDGEPGERAGNDRRRVRTERDGVGAVAPINHRTARRCHKSSRRRPRRLPQWRDDDATAS